MPANPGHCQHSPEIPERLLTLVLSHRRFSHSSQGLATLNPGPSPWPLRSVTLTTSSFIHYAWSGQSPVLWTTSLVPLQALCPYCYSFSLEDFQEPSHGSLCHCLQVSAQLSPLRGSVLAPSLEEQFLCTLPFALYPLSPCSSSFLFIAVFFTNHYIWSHFYVHCLLSY